MATTIHTPVCRSMNIHILREMWFFIFIALIIEATFFSSHVKSENCSLLCAPVTPKQLDDCLGEMLSTICG